MTYNIPGKVPLLHLDDSGKLITTPHVQLHLKLCVVCAWLLNVLIHKPSQNDSGPGHLVTERQSISFQWYLKERPDVLENSVNNTQSILSDSVEQGQWNTAKAMVLHQCILQSMTNKIGKLQCMSRYIDQIMP